MSRRWWLWGGFASFALLVVLLFFSMAAPATGHEQHEGGEHPAVSLPSAWNGFSRTALVQGQEALTEINRLHNKSIQIHEGYRADYLKGAEQFTVWIAQTADAAGARALQDQMTASIGGNNQMFSQPQPVTVAGQTLYRSEGMGQVHFYYVKGSAVYWVAVGAADPHALITQILGQL